MTTTIDKNGIRWRKSRESSGSNACVEVAPIDTGVTENR